MSLPKGTTAQAIRNPTCLVSGDWWDQWEAPVSGAAEDSQTPWQCVALWHFTPRELGILRCHPRNAALHTFRFEAASRVAQPSTPNPPVRFMLGFALGETWEYVGGVWQPPTRGATGRVVQIEGLPYDMLGLWAFLPDQDPAAGVIWNVKIQGDIVGAQTGVTWGRFTLPGK